MIEYAMAVAKNYRDYVAEFGVVGAWDVLRQRRSNSELVIRCRGYKEPFVCRSFGSDFAMLRGVIGRREVHLPMRVLPSRIIDAGANVGFATRAFHSQFPDARILAVEPDEANCRVFRRNVTSDDRIELLQGALWGTTTRVEIANPAAQSASFEVRECGQGSAAEVATVTMDQLLGRLGGADIVKIDIEGAEESVFARRDLGWVDGVGVILIELHERKRPGITQAVFRALEPRSRSVRKIGEYDVFDLQGLLA